ncbi:sterile alpha motif domain containing 1a [Triplophysa rosa]|uniref:Sterile alpha motif domain containing 1a n=1 Tax=Triplophysa rosa TaxID=992332 RepID=A0A9W7WKV0_TRIRA|nr:sterile alpha motif domain containing 1a [Triplophysa rosa]KAI7803644.1 putative sterile alpha motif domain containing 1a [Triplophysa rosa]
MSEPYREWILGSIDSLRSRKARPDLERICRMVKRRHGSDWDRTRTELEKLIEEQTVLKVNYKGSVSYRNAAKVLRGRRKTEQSKCAVKQPSPPDWSTGDSALGLADEDQMEDMEDEMSTTAGMDSSMDEEGDESSLDTMCAQSTTDSGISMSPITSSNISLPAPSPTTSPKSSPTHDALRQDGDSAYILPDHAAQQQGTGSPELGQQPLAICPSAQQSAPQGEEGPRAEESALTSDPPLSDCGAMPNDAVTSDRAPHAVSVNVEDGEKCNNELNSMTEVHNGGINDGTEALKEEIGQDPSHWTVADVAKYITSVGFPEQAAAFKTQEIDGKSLMLMQRSDVLTGLSIRLGPALKIYENHVKVLQRSHFQDDNRLFS